MQWHREVGRSLSFLSNWCKCRKKLMSFVQQPGKDMLVGLVLPFQDTVLPSAVGHQQCLSAAGRHLLRGTFRSRGVGLLQEKRQCRSSRGEGSNAGQGGMCQVSLPSSFCFNLGLGKNLVCCSVEESVLHGTACAKLLCCCYLSYHARLAAPCHPALLCASPGQELGTL